MVGFRLNGKPAGDTVAVRLIVPEKPLMLEMKSVDEADEPAVIVRLLGMAEMTKSGVVMVEKLAV